MTAAVRHCPICGDEIPATAHRLKKMCGKKECMMEQQRISGRKSYHKLLGHTKPEKKSCVVCGTDISNLRGNRVVCLKPKCKESIVKRSKNDYYERNYGTSTAVERRRQASRAYRAKHQPWKNITAISAPKKTIAAPLSKPAAKPAIDTRYQRKPKDSSKFEIRPKPLKKVENVTEEDTNWTPRALNLPEFMPAHSKPAESTRPASKFADTWNCAACREHEHLCRLHQSMTDDDMSPPTTYQY